MAVVAKNTNLSLSTYLPPATSRLTGFVAGEVLARNDACYQKSDGTIWRCNGATSAVTARFKGLAATACAVGEPVTLLHNLNVDYGSGMTPGTDLYVSATVGALDTATSTYGVNPVACVISPGRIMVFPLR